MSDLRSAAEDVQSLRSTCCSDLGEIQLSVIAARVGASHLVLMSAFISRGIRSEEK